MSTTVSSPSSMNVIDAWKTAMEFHFDRFQAAREACRSLMINEVRQRMLQDLRPSSPLYQQRVQSIHDDDDGGGGGDEASFSPSSQSVTAMLDGDDSNYALISRTCNLRGSDGTTLVTFTDNDAAEKKITPHVEMPVLDECDVVKGLPIPRPVVALAPPPAIAKVKKSKPRKPKDPPVASGGGKRRQRASASASATVFPFDVHETSQHVADRRAAIRRLIAQMPLDKQEWRWKGPKQKKPRATKRRKTDDDEDGQTLAAAAAKPKSAPVPKKGYPKDSAVGLWLDAMCKCLAGFTHRVFTRTVDMNGVMDEVLRSPAPGAQEVKNDGIIEIPRDFRCMDCRQGIQTSQQNTRKDLAILLCECERRKASICLSCKVARWARELPCSDGGPDLQPFDEQGNLKHVKCQAPRCQTYWTPEDLLILQTVTKFYAPPPVSAN